MWVIGWAMVVGGGGRGKFLETSMFTLWGIIFLKSHFSTYGKRYFYKKGLKSGSQDVKKACCRRCFWKTLLLA